MRTARFRDLGFGEHLDKIAELVTTDGVRCSLITTCRTTDNDVIISAVQAVTVLDTVVRV